jgi:hypothetical protein
MASDEAIAGSFEKCSVFLFGTFLPTAPAHHMDVEEFREMRLRRARHDVLNDEDAAAQARAAADRLQDLRAFAVLATVPEHRGHMLPDCPMLWATFQHRHVSQRAGRIGTQNGAAFSQVEVAARCLIQKVERCKRPQQPVEQSWIKAGFHGDIAGGANAIGYPAFVACSTSFELGVNLAKPLEIFAGIGPVD